MVSKLLVISLFLISCGREVTLSNSKLEKFSSITEADSAKTLQTGTLLRASKNGDSDYIKVSNTSYKVSPYSSFNALKFISLAAAGTEVSVKFTGTIKKTEIVLETLEENNN